MGNLGATAQASVPGVYAWSVTVAPVAFAHGASYFAGASAACGIAALAGAPVLEGRHPQVARILSVWGLVSTSLLVWIAAPSGSLSPLRIDLLRGVAGMVGWALFAFASAAPAIARPLTDFTLLTSSRALRPRTPAGLGDTAILWAGFVLAGVTQVVGWRVVEPERGVLVRLLGLAGGLAALSTANSIVAARHAMRKVDSPRRRAGRAIVPLVLFALLAGGALVAARAMPR
jgi:hypothetical protein